MAARARGVWAGPLTRNHSKPFGVQKKSDLEFSARSNFAVGDRPWSCPDARAVERVRFVT
eukprot:4423493-Prymnesium_polylepis.1